MPASDRDIAELRELIAARQVVVIVGSGLSIQATGRAPAASWDGLLRLGLRACRECDPSLDDRWEARRIEDLSSGLEDTLGVAERVHSQLGERAPGALKRWLRASFEKLPLTDQSGLHALVGLGVPLATTNYDDLLERATDLPPVTWQDQGEVFRVLRGEERAILHLHGFWKKPESIVVGIQSYQRVRQDPHARAVMESLAMTRCLVFVGCGEGLGDPNFRRFFDWLRSVNSANEALHYRLVLDGEVANAQKLHPPEERLRVLGYGKEHGDLAGFLAGLVPPAKPSSPVGATGGSGIGGPAALTPALLAYRRRVGAATSRLELIGLGRGVAVDLPIESAYLPLRTAVSRDLLGQKPTVFAAPRTRGVALREENLDLSGMFGVAARFEQRAALLLGDPGAGKTTGARQLCWRLLHPEKAGGTSGLPAGTFPVFLRLRNLTQELLGKDLRSFVYAETASDALAEEVGRPGPDLVARTGVLWVFDGLDEVVSEDARVRVCDWIRQWQRDRPDDYVLVTSRFQGYQGPVELGAAFCEFHVQPLNQAQAAEFVSRWYAAVFRRLYGGEAAIGEKAEVETTALLKLLEEPAYRIGRLRELPANPLLLTILCLVHHEDHSLPRKRAAVYARCLRVLLEHWRKEMRQAQRVASFDPEAAEQVLGEVAWWLHDEENRTSADLTELGSRAKTALAEVSEASGLGREGDLFVRRMRDDSGILAMWGGGRCGFLHLTFQEYLAGLHAAREGLAKALVERMPSSWWREAILVALAVGSKAFAKEFFGALLGTDALRWDVSLVDQCLDEASAVPIEPFVEALRSGETTAPCKAAILRRLRMIQNSELDEVCGELAWAKDGELAAVAREVVERQRPKGVAPAIVTSRRPLETWVDERTGIAYVALPGGEFSMGSERGRDNEKPVHRVRLSAFAIGKYAVTNAEYGRFLADKPEHRRPSYWTDSQWNDPQQPVVGVCWDDARAFCEWAGASLPTEAQWEYGCRAGSTTEYCFDEKEARLADYAWYGENSGGKMHAVGEKRANAWGLHDLHGNVWEWCADWYGEYETGKVTDPTGPNQGDNRVLRGGSWFIPAVYCRSAYRYRYDPAYRSQDIGFRVVLAPRSEGRDEGQGTRDEG